MVFVPLSMTPYNTQTGETVLSNLKESILKIWKGGLAVVTSVTLDSHSVNLRCFKLLQVQYDHISFIACLCHKFSTILTEALAKMTEAKAEKYEYDEILLTVLSKNQRISSNFGGGAQSTGNVGRWRAFWSREHPEQPRAPLVPRRHDLRWANVVLQIQTVVKCWGDYKKFYALGAEKGPQNPPELHTTEEYEVLVALLSLCEPIRLAIELVEGNYTTASLYLACCAWIERVLSMECKHPVVDQVRLAMSSKFGYVFAEGKVDRPFLMQIALCDPRVKALRFATQQEREDAKEAIFQKMVAVAGGRGPGDVPKSEAKAGIDIGDIFGSPTFETQETQEGSTSTKTVKTEEANLRAQLERYEFSPFSTGDTKSIRSFDVLNWWRLNAHNFPELSEVAVSCLTACASGAFVERMNSHVGNLIGVKRTSMTYKRVERLALARECMLSDLVPLDFSEDLQEFEFITEDEAKKMTVEAQKAFEPH